MKRVGLSGTSSKANRVINYGGGPAKPTAGALSSSPSPSPSAAIVPKSEEKPNPPPAAPTSRPTSVSSTLSKPNHLVKPKIATQSQSSSTQPSPTNAAPAVGAADESYWAVMWCKASNKKHKTYNDGILSIAGVMATLQDSEGKTIGKSRLTPQIVSELKDGATIDFSRNEIEIMNKISREDFMSGKAFLAGNSGGVSDSSSLPGLLKYAPKGTLGVGVHTKKKLSKDTRLIQRYDPDAPGAVVLYRPSPEKVGSEVAVVLEPRLAVQMRPHQAEGVKFIYECINGLRDIPGGGTGCILADEMGLGKTLQSIALIRTMLSQGPMSRENSPKVIVVTPTSLVGNWVKETQKWLGSERLKPVWVGESVTKETKKKLEDFVSAPVQQMLVISYENLRQNVEILKKCKFGLMICDEGHRLKNTDAKITKSLLDLNCPRRVILTGTPFQNNLSEFYSLSNFVNPGILGSPAQFRQIYDNPISKLHDPRCTPAQRSLGQERASELFRMTRTFILRRTSDVLEKFLPPKVEHVIFCRPTPTQIDLMKHFLESEFVKRALTGQASSLACIQHLSKILNHPELLFKEDSAAASAKSASAKSKKKAADIEDELDQLDSDEDDDIEGEEKQSLFEYFPSGYKRGSFDPSVASKIQVLQQILHTLDVKDKIVIVSNFTKTLDVIEELCAKNLKLTTLRLDGSTDNSVRQQRVDWFQSDPKYRVFLLSTKAGGVGLNLFAANRLVLFDSGWNPAHDAQAQARVWRDGQQQKTFIYRLVTTGTLEEKIFQRQLSKMGMSKTVVDSDGENFFASSSSRHFSPDELKRVFSLNENTNCDTHELAGCLCVVSSLGETSNKRRKLNSGAGSSTCELSVQEIADWRHLTGVSSSPDPVLSQLQSDAVSFMFLRETSPSMTKQKSPLIEAGESVEEDSWQEEGEESEH